MPARRSDANDNVPLSMAPRFFPSTLGGRIGVTAAGLAGALLMAAVFLGGTGKTAGTMPAQRNGLKSARAGSTFTNPVVTAQAAPDPSVVYHDGWYYLTATLTPSEGLWVWRSRTLTDWSDATKKKVWDAPESGPMSRQLWAPELQRLRGRWYLYFTASDGEDDHHRHYALASDAPMGPYENKGRVDESADRYAIDGAVLRAPSGQLFWMYTTYEKLGLVPMENPATVDSTARRITLAEPTEPWERGWIEAPEPLVHEGNLFVVYSAGHSATPHYVLGRLTHTGGPVADPASWEKHPRPVFAPYVGAEGAVYTTGHNSFTTSPDGSESWLVYHGKPWSDPQQRGFSGRMARAQRFTWRPDGTPDFGHPVPGGVPLVVPSGSSRTD